MTDSESGQGGDQIFVELEVSDGLHTDCVRSPFFSARGRAPRVKISTREPVSWNNRINIAASVRVGHVEGLTDRVKFSWTSSLDGYLSDGERLSQPASMQDGSRLKASLVSPGRHLITLTVTDRYGRQGSDSCKVWID